MADGVMGKSKKVCIRVNIMFVLLFFPAIERLSYDSLTVYLPAVVYGNYKDNIPLSVFRISFRRCVLCEHGESLPDIFFIIYLHALTIDVRTFSCNNNFKHNNILSQSTVVSSSRVMHS